MSYNQLLYHIVFSTYMRRKTIDVEHDAELYSYISGIVKHLKGFVMAINGMPDHVHLVASLPVDHPLSYYIKEIKQSTSLWLRSNSNFPDWEHWSKGYAIITCSPLAIDPVLNYVRAQKEQHKKASFEDELRQMLSMLGIEYNPFEMMK